MLEFAASLVSLTEALAEPNPARTAILLAALYKCMIGKGLSLSTHLRKRVPNIPPKQSECRTMHIRCIPLPKA